MRDPVKAQYEAYPYPERDPAEETRRLIVGSPSHLLEVNHYVFGGRRDFARPFRALIAGGGTGDGTIMLAQQLAWRGSPAEVVYIDVSRAAMRIAEARARARGLKNVRFLHGSLLDLTKMGLGRFDYIDCCGVLHHLPDPRQGLKVLGGALAEDGGMGVMVYGELGRTGVYHMQAMLRLLTRDGEPDKARLALARRLYQGLGPTNWLKRNPFVGDHRQGGDAGLYDLFLHSRDRAYRVPEVAQLVASAGLEITAFIVPARYDPATYLTDPELKGRAARLPWIERCALAELLAGNLKSHVFYTVKAGRAMQAVARPDGADATPVLREADGPALARGLEKGARLAMDFDGVKVRYALPALAPAILKAMDGRRSLEEIHRALACDGGPDRAGFKAAFDRLYAVLNGLNVMLIAYPSDTTG
ncbi:MAG: class I SAM-dependent methyltransferase [Alphaproteobacteria bacterium]